MQMQGSLVHSVTLSLCVPRSFLARGLPRCTARWRPSRRELTSVTDGGAVARQPKLGVPNNWDPGSSACVVCGCAGPQSFTPAPFAMPFTRDPFQHPTLDNDDSYLGKARASKKLPYKNPNHLAQQQEPWSRLNSTPTVTSMRREVYFFDPEIPKDDLDFRLAALYNHHTGTFKNKNETLLHQETTQDTHGIIKTQFPGEPLPPPLPPSITSQANIRHWINPKKESIHSIQGSIVSPHTAATNGGYSRKNDGGFFST
uniref:cilia- and flagella-associated protein 276 n=1 Tax=Panthera onca TaxID=9690 RepID=UPI0029555B68|nr:cilia- and flagella-associated protein 276 [Panthera onca]